MENMMKAKIRIAGTTAVVGYYLDMRGSNIHSFFEWIGVSALAGAVFLALMWIATRSQMQLTHKQYWTREIVASGVGGLLTAVLMTGIMWGTNSIRPQFLITNLVIGVFGYLIGSLLNDVVQIIREKTRKAHK
jgi:drug/metabolite transporter (DMT)-like permease